MKFTKFFLASLLAFVVGSVVVTVLFFMLVAGLAGSVEPKAAVPGRAVLAIDFSEMLVDAPSVDPLAGIDFSTMEAIPQLSLFKALRAIEAAAADDRIKGIYIRPNGLGGVDGMAVLEELRNAIIDFKKSGKFVVAYNESWSQALYLLASAADKVYIQPEGGLDWSGLSADIMFYKGLMDKLDLKVEVFRPTVCKYKSAVEPYILDGMSDANREQMQAYVDSMWESYCNEVAAARGKSVEELKALADNLKIALPDDALQHGLVDGLLYEDQVGEEIARLSGGDDYGFVSLHEYSSVLGADLKNLSADEVAVVYANGQIVDGEGVGMIYGNTLAATIADVRLDEKVKAVVLRVNSPGGSALASDVIWREIELLKAEKPVIVSMGSAAASGGYYISCPADAIVADRMTTTGSIGVFGLMINAEKALKNKLGITVDGVKSSSQAGISPYKAITPAQRAAMMRGVDRVYETFTNNVAEGRNLPIEKVLDIAGGRIWTGADAVEIGLVDAIGGLKTAIAIAVDKSGLGTSYRIREVTEPQTGLAAFLSSFNVSIREAAIRSELGEAMTEYRRVQDALRNQGVLMYSPYTFEFN